MFREMLEREVRQDLMEPREIEAQTAFPVKTVFPDQE